MRLEGTRSRFSQRHPFVFGVMMILVAVVLVMGATAFLRFLGWTPHSVGMGRDRLGMVSVEGVILDAAEVVEWIRTLKDDGSIKGVLLRVNSPGGAIAPSQEIYQAVAALAEVKPVVASYGTVAASGGYYASAPAHVIVANPGSITASIGVMAEFVTVTEALEKLGIKPEVLTTGKFKAAGTPMRELTFEQREQLLDLMRDLHDQFVGDVARARKMPFERVAAVADGRGVTGRQALELGLVDMLGSETQAFDKLKAMCSIKGSAELVKGPVKEQSLLEKFVGSLKIDLSSSTGQGWTFSYK